MNILYVIYKILLSMLIHVYCGFTKIYFVHNTPQIHIVSHQIYHHVSEVDIYMNVIAYAYMCKCVRVNIRTLYAHTDTRGCGCLCGYLIKSILTTHINRTMLMFCVSSTFFFVRRLIWHWTTDFVLGVNNDYCDVIESGQWLPQNHHINCIIRMGI